MLKLLETNCGNEFDNFADCSNRFMNYLGFTFDGCKVRIRSKTTTKYYYRMYSKAKTIAKNGGYSYKGRRISKKNLYKFILFVVPFVNAVILLVMLNARRVFSETMKQSTVIQKGICKKLIRL